jgi:hypothetical protein
MATKKKTVETIEWLAVDDAESRLQALRDRDLEIGRIAQGLSMRQRISELEAENAHLSLTAENALEELAAWKGSSTFRLARIFTRPLGVFKRAFRR